MAKNAAPLIQVSTLMPFLRAVEDAGLSASELGPPIGITPEMLADRTSLAPANSIYRFAELAAEALGQPHLGVRLGLDPEITRWPVVSEAFSDSRVMVEFLSRFLLTSQSYTTNVEYRLELGGEVSWFWRDRGFVPSPNPAQIDAFSVGMFVNLFRTALGEHWQASDMLFRICDPDAARIPEISPCALVRGDSRKLAFSFPSRWLIHPMQVGQAGKTAGTAHKPPSEALITAIRSNIRLNLRNPDFGVPELVAQMGFNRRRVQKFLRERGSGLANLIEEERKGLARDLLERGDRPLEEIAQALGYRDVSNFSRAFRRWTGVPPSHWRDGRR